MSRQPTVSLQESRHSTPPSRSRAALGGPSPGEVVLVGAGPGDPGLITVAGLGALREADVVVFDRLVCMDLLAEISPAAKRIDVGKTPGGPSVDQQTIHRLLIEEALRGRRVVRLKGGDPFLFGRGGEEVLALRAAGIPVRWIPGLSSALSAPALAGIPITHRRVASSVGIVTGHPADDAPQPWAALATLDTLVILMGVATLADSRRELLRCGRPGRTPVAIVERASLPSQRVLRTTLVDLVDTALNEGVTSPAVVVVGEVTNVLRRIDDEQQLSDTFGSLLPTPSRPARTYQPRGAGPSAPNSDELPSNSKSRTHPERRVS